MRIDLTDIDENLKSSFSDFLSRVDRIFISSQIYQDFSQKQIRDLKISTIISLNINGEEDSKLFLNQNNVKFISHPIPEIERICFDDLTKINPYFQKNQSILIYSKSANKASIFLALYFYSICGHPKERCLELSKRLGVTKQNLVEKLAKKMEHRFEEE